MVNALIGFSGFVGGTLMKQMPFDHFYRSTNLHEAAGNVFDTVVCSAAPAQKWIANLKPAEDRKNILSLMEKLASFQCRCFILISTVDVFSSPRGVDEDSSADDPGNSAYGLHRRELEVFVQKHFKNHLIVRLPGLVGPGLRKNIIYDFFHENNLSTVDSRGVFQFYPMTNLCFDIKTALTASLKLVHLTAEPISVGDLSREGFAKPFENMTANPPARYDMQSRHAALFGGARRYQYSRRETIQAVRAYAQSEPLKVVLEPLSAV